MKTGVELIAQERDEQIEKHGFTVGRDVVENRGEQLTEAVIKLLDENSDRMNYPEGWSEIVWWRMMSKPYKERLIIAGALLAAEIDRLQAHER